jgi:hypothetical protein
LPLDWIERAQAALVAKTVPGFKPWRLFLPQNLMPFAAMLAVALIASATLLRAAVIDGAAAYRKGNFAAAEKNWKERLATKPTDWIARHNLSLALSQQERPGEAAAHATAAFVQHPSDPSVRWHFGLAAEKSGAIPQSLAPFLTPGPAHSVARLASPATWQTILILAAWLTAVAFGLLLFNFYGSRAPVLSWVAAALLFGALTTAGAAVGGVTSYGLAAKPDAVVVARASILRSIPTEADTTQKTSPLAVGSLARMDKAFLGWIRLSFENGQTGWVRKEDLVALWK